MCLEEPSPQEPCSLGPHQTSPRSLPRRRREPRRRRVQALPWSLWLCLNWGVQWLWLLGPQFWVTR